MRHLQWSCAMRILRRFIASSCVLLVGCQLFAQDGSTIYKKPLCYLSRRGRGACANVAGQKSGVVHAVDPDKNGDMIWQTRVGKGGALGGIQRGSAADQSHVYVALSDIARTSILRRELDPKLGGGMFSL